MATLMEKDVLIEKIASLSARIGSVGNFVSRTIITGEIGRASCRERV